MITVVSSQREITYTIGTWAVQFNFQSVSVGCLAEFGTPIFERGIFNEGITLEGEMLDLNIINDDII